jgi:hypothetical protein
MQSKFVKMESQPMPRSAHASFLNQMGQGLSLQDGEEEVFLKEIL